MAAPTGWASLTPTERVVVDLVVSGATNAAIAAPLVPKTLSTFTVTVEFIDLVPPAIPAAAPATS